MAARGGRGRGRGHGRGPNQPVTMEQLLQTQNQLMEAFMHHLQDPPQNQPTGGPPPVQVRDKRGEFMKGHPPVFTHAAEPLEVDDWVRVVEKQLNIA
jgi:hypothetical protein